MGQGRPQWGKEGLNGGREGLKGERRAFDRPIS